MNHWLSVCISLADLSSEISGGARRQQRAHDLGDAFGASCRPYSHALLDGAAVCPVLVDQRIRVLEKRQKQICRVGHGAEQIRT